MPDVKSVVSREELDAVMETAKQSDQLVRGLHAARRPASRPSLAVLFCISVSARTAPAAPAPRETPFASNDACSHFVPHTPRNAAIPCCARRRLHVVLGAARTLVIPHLLTPRSNPRRFASTFGRPGAARVA